MGDPKSLKGGFHWLALGFVGSMLALGFATLVPSIIPARAAQSRL
jgi:hypothetical protein